MAKSPPIPPAQRAKGDERARPDDPKLASHGIAPGGADDRHRGSAANLAQNVGPARTVQDR